MGWGRLSTCVVLAGALVALPAIAGRAQAVPAPSCSYAAAECNVEYVRGGRSRNQVLDVFYTTRRSRTPRPAVIFVHGGGWWGGDKTNLAYREWNAPRAAAARGWVAFNINYRLGDDPDRPGPGDTVAPYRDQPADVAASVQWVRANAARYGVDPNRLALVGASAGAHLALLTAYTSAPVKAVVSWAGPTNLNSMSAAYPCVDGHDGRCVGGRYPVASEMLRRLATCTSVQCPDRYRMLSPVAHVRGRLPATLQIRGAFDTTVPPEQAGELHQALRRAGATSAVTECVVARGAVPWPCTHESISAEVWAPTEAFLAARL